MHITVGSGVSDNREHLPLGAKCKSGRLLVEKLSELDADKRAAMITMSCPSRIRAFVGVLTKARLAVLAIRLRHKFAADRFFLENMEREEKLRTGRASEVALLKCRFLYATGKN